jgi:hypothetical protein
VHAEDGAGAPTVPDHAGAVSARVLRGLPPTPEEVGRAAALCVLDQQTDAQIAQQLGIGRRTLARWKQRPEFVAAMTALRVWQALHAVPPREPTSGDAP